MENKQEKKVEEQALVLEKKEDTQVESPQNEKSDPTRFGDWERNGRCIDF